MQLDLIVDIGATRTLLPAEAVAEHGLETPRRRAVTPASGERVVYPTGDVRVRLNDEEWPTSFLAGPPGCGARLGLVTLEEFALTAPGGARGLSHHCVKFQETLYGV